MDGAMDFLHEMAAEPSGGDGGNAHIEEKDEDDWEEVNCDDSGTSNGYALGTDIIDGLELQAVGSVSARVGRGKHTTRNVTLIEMMPTNNNGGGIINGNIGYGTKSTATTKGGLLADTPGFSQPHLTGILPTQLAFLFPEVLNKMEEAREQGRQLCAFQNCQHLHEPGCGLIEGGWERHGMYVDLHAEVSEIAGMDAQRAGSKKRREGMLRKKSGSGGVQREEARLEAKTYRRVSRKQEKQQLLSELAEQQKEEAEEQEEEEEEEGGGKA
jgi:ribosome biogenesis GTPase